MQRLTYITLLVGFLMLTAFAGLWWTLLQPVNSAVKPAPSTIMSTQKPGN